MPSSPPYPLGLPLTESMELTARDGTCWLAYIEGIPSPPPSRRWRRQTLLPARRLRFDSVSESRATTPVPAGAPFLTEARLQALLDRAAPLDDLSPAVRPDPQRRVLSAARATRLAAAALAGAALAEGGRRWRRASDGRRTLRSRAEDMVAGAADRLVVWVAGFLKGRPRARF